MKKEHDSLNYWSRKFHIHLGLLLLLFIWLFSLSGLLLNHNSKWKFAGFWDQRIEKTTRTTIYPVPNLDSAALLKNIMQQLRISGEVSRVWVTADSIDFRVSTPGHERNLCVNLIDGTCVQKELMFNGWGKLRILHTFNGYDKNNPAIQPNWIVTRIWQLSKDIIAGGLIVMSISSWIMWYKLSRKYKWGIVFLLSGMAVSLYFILL
jgi:hypothetical protein